MNDLSDEEQALWRRVEDLWSLSLARDAEQIRRTLHPGYVGWDMNSPAPHDREAAVQSVVGEAPVVADYELTPLSIKVYEHTVGVVHYAYRATLAPGRAAPRRVTGKWSEVYLRQGGEWVMISVSGRPDLPEGGGPGSRQESANG